MSMFDMLVKRFIQNAHRLLYTNSNATIVYV